MIVRCRKCGRAMVQEKVDYDHIHWTCECGYKSKTDYTTLTKKVNPYEARFNQPIIDFDDKGLMSITSEDERKLELLSIEEISKLSSTDEPLEKVLSEIVEKIAKRLDVEVCSIYLFTGEELVLSATWGLSRESIGRVRLGLGEGITGSAAEGGEPLVIEDASLDRRYKYFSITREEEFRGMVSCPVRDEKSLLAVINIQTTEKRLFDSYELNYISIVANLLKNCLKIRDKKK